MTVIDKSTMKVRKRYRAAHSRNSDRRTLVIMNGLFLICFAIYQIILSKSNGGREAVASTYKSFLKGGPRDSAEQRYYKTDDTAGPEMKETIAQEKHIIEERRGVIHDPFSNENEVKEQADIHDPFSKENEVDVQEDFHNPFSKENEVDVQEDFHNPFSKENEVDVQADFHDPFSKENEVDVQADFHDPFSKENEVSASADVFSEDESGSLFEEGSSGQPYVFDPDHQMFHNYYPGKSGKVVEEMLIAHAYIFHRNSTYGGCCGTKSTKMTAHEDLLDALGLKDVLRFRCPRDYVHDTITKRSVIARDKYLDEDTHLWTPDYVDYLRTLVTYPEKRHKEYTIVVHMLRGNASPCKEKNRGFQSYLPNLHYQNLIDKYYKPGARVIIYTSAKTFESLSEFRNRGYEVNTGTGLKEMWKEFVTADVFIMSRSDFSMVPAMVAKGTVVYTPFWHRTLRQWRRASKSIMKETNEETRRLQLHCDK